MSSNKNQLNVPQAKEAMERFKMECANEVGVQSHLEELKIDILCAFRNSPKLP